MSWAGCVLYLVISKVRTIRGEKLEDVLGRVCLVSSGQLGRPEGGSWKVSRAGCDLYIVISKVRTIRGEKLDTVLGRVFCF